MLITALWKPQGWLSLWKRHWVQRNCCNPREAGFLKRKVCLQGDQADNLSLGLHLELLHRLLGFLKSFHKSHSLTPAGYSADGHLQSGKHCTQENHLFLLWSPKNCTFRCPNLGRKKKSPPLRTWPILFFALLTSLSTPVHSADNQNVASQKQMTSLSRNLSWRAHRKSQTSFSQVPIWWNQSPWLKGAPLYFVPVMMRIGESPWWTPGKHLANTLPRRDILPFQGLTLKTRVTFTIYKEKRPLTSFIH